eukprot:3209983-Pyramimonas_sp.AAC.1
MRAVPLELSVKLPMRPRSAILGGVDACGRCRWGLRWSSLRGHETVDWMGVTHAGGATGAFGEAPYGAT